MPNSILAELAPFVLIGTAGWFIYKRRKEKKLEKLEKPLPFAGEQEIMSTQRNALPGYEAEGEKLDQYVKNLAEAYSTLKILPRFNTYNLAGYRLSKDEKRHASRVMDVIRESASIIEKSNSIDTIKSRLDVIFSNLDHIIDAHSSRQSRAVRTLLEEATPHIYTIGYFREIQTSLNKIASLKTEKAKLRHYDRIKKLTQDIDILNYAHEEEVDAIERFCAQHLTASQ